MRKILFFVVILLLLLTACASVRPIVDEDARVQSFLAIFTDAKYVESSFEGDEAAALRDVVVQECGAAVVPDAFIRANYLAKSATLSAYVADGELVCVASKLNPDAFEIEKGDPSTVAEGTLVTVNGEPITAQDIEQAALALQPAVRNQTSAGILLNQLVDQELLQQASKDVVLSAEEVDAALEAQWRAAGFDSVASFTAALEERNVSLEEYRSLVESDLKVQRHLVEVGITVVNVSEEDARAFYLDNPNNFLLAEQVRFRQLFISFEGDRDAAESRLQSALGALNGGTDFCAAIRRYSDDVESRDRCGEYLSPRGVLLPMLEAAIFSLEVNESSIVESDNGFHIVLVTAKQPTTVLSYAQAREQVYGVLQNSRVQERLSIYLLKLRGEAEIIDYS